VLSYGPTLFDFLFSFKDFPFSHIQNNLKNSRLQKVASYLTPDKGSSALRVHTQQPLDSESVALKYVYYELLITCVGGVPNSKKSS